MSILQIIVLLVALGIVMFLVNKYAPMAPMIKTILNVVVAIVVIIWLLNVFGMFEGLESIRVGHWRHR